MPDSNDPYATRLEGELVGFTFRSDDGGFAVARLKDERGVEHVIIGPIAHLSVGNHLSVEGRLSEHPRFGTRLKVRGYLVEDPRTLEGLHRYLASADVKGLGPELAQRVVEAFGLETLTVLDRSPQRLREVSGIGPKRVERIVEHWGKDRALREVSVMLRGHGLGAAITRRVVERYGDKALTVVTTDPYRLAGEIPGVAFRTADAIARSMGIGEDDPRRARAAVRWLLQEAAGQGHCYLPESELERRALNHHVLGESLHQAVASLGVEGRVVKEGLDDSGEPRIWQAETLLLEQRVARRLSARGGEQAVDLSQVQMAAERQGIQLAPEQARAVGLALGARLVVITGGPGTGKTTLVRVLLDAAGKRGEKWALAAPTGRAAKRLSESCEVESRTLHRLLGYNPGKGGFTRNSDNPIEADAVLVDEVSMVDLPLMDRLLDALTPKTKLVLVGDADQLPSVGPGRVLGDLIDSGAVPVARLARVFRQQEDSGIVRNAHRILDGTLPVSSENENGSDFYVLGREDPDVVRDTLLEVVTRRLPARGFDPFRDVQVLTPMHRGPLGSRALNTALQEALNPEGPELVRGDRRIRVGDRVLQNRNDYDNDVFNGDVGTVVGVDAGSLEVDFGGRNVSLVGEQVDALSLAYAISIHKSQGSEYKAVVILLHTSHFVMLRRNLVYTATTRARNFCCLLGSRRAIDMAVRRVGGGERHTGLAERLKSMAGGLI
ncbi:MAG: ATP-dependent RecD-like DNA helicase [Myxococcota bacterium]|nr:ATP-dependent RecD-like DNA helicase [Myxococcota bacterium]